MDTVFGDDAEAGSAKRVAAFVHEFLEGAWLVVLAPGRRVAKDADSYLDRVAGVDESDPAGIR